MATIAFYFHSDDVVNFEIELGLEMYDYIDDKIELLTNGSIVSDCYDYLYDDEHHYVIYMESEYPSKYIEEVYEILNKWLPLVSTVIIEISLCKDRKYQPTEPLYIIDRMT